MELTLILTTTILPDFTQEEGENKSPINDNQNY